MHTELQYDTLCSLEERFGPSFYLYHPRAFRRNYEEFLAAFRALYPRTQLAYSYKTNYLPEIGRTVDYWGGYAEVVSSMEYDLAIRLKVAPERIIFNGPLKTKAVLKRALGQGSVVNLDSGYELSLVEEIAAELGGKSLRVGLRCNFDVGTELPSRFGFDVSSSMCEEAVARMRVLPNVILAGLHCHFLPPGRSAEEYGAIAREMVRLTRDVFGSELPEFIDLGGGFFSRENPAFHRQFNVKISTPEEYAAAMASPMAEAFPEGKGPELILEPGMAVVADTMELVTRILDIKTVRDRTVALAGASVYNTIPRKSSRNLPVQRIAAPDGASQRADGPLEVAGYTCMEDDVLYRAYEGPLQVGDYLVFENVGAYTFVLKPPFILPAPAILAVDPSTDGVRVLRQVESLEDVFSSYTFPE